jgi:F0F1-type ATP synthase membrane subunit c/vacuolar-type H+-ATPase subunit K
MLCQLLVSSLSLSLSHIVGSFSIIFCEAVAIYGIIMAAVLQTKVVDTSGRPVNNHDFYAGFGIFWAGVVVGLCNLACGYVKTFLLFLCFTFVKNRRFEINVDSFLHSQN